MTKSQIANAEKPYDIKKRTFKFGVDIVLFVNDLQKSISISVLGKQLIRAGTSVGANTEEADGSKSKKDFIHKISIARKEARESNYWLRILEATCNCKVDTLKSLIKESSELVLILSKIIQNAKSRSNQHNN